jgi:hypothetical protein
MDASPPASTLANGSQSSFKDSRETFAPSPSQSPPPIPASASTPKAATPTPSAADNKNIVRRKLTGYVGFANLPNQWHRKSVRKGFNFNVMVVGTLSSLFSKSKAFGVRASSFIMRRCISLPCRLRKGPLRLIYWLVQAVLAYCELRRSRLVPLTMYNVY